MAARPSDLFKFTFQVSGEKQVAVMLGALKGAVSNLEPVWSDIRADFLQGEQEQFDSQGGSGSGGWAALSPPYAAWKTMKAPGAPILVLSGALRASLTQDSDSMAVYRPQRLGLEIGSRVPYARYHQTGTSRMPSRPPIELTARQKRLWPRLVMEFITKSGQASRARL